MKRAVLFLILLAIGAAIGWHLRQYAPLLGLKCGAVATSFDAKDRTAAQQPKADLPEAVVALGRVEPSGGVIDVGGTPGDRLARLLVEEGSPVKKGGEIAELESRPIRKLELDAAQRQLQLAEGRLAAEGKVAAAKVDIARLGVRKAETAARGIEAQKKKIALLESTLALARNDQQRLDGLSKELVAEQERQRQALLVEQAECELLSARAALKQMEQSVELGLEAARLELAAAEQAAALLPFTIPLPSLQTARDLAEAVYNRTMILAPCDGVVLKTHVRAGETLGVKPVAQIANLDRMSVVAEVYENEIKHLRVGQKAEITSNALRLPAGKKTLHGSIKSIGMIVGIPVLKNVDPFAPTDRHVVEVRVELDAESSRLAATLTNLQVDVRFPKEGLEIRD
jgi:HlyD family secretion protein